MPGTGNGPGIFIADKACDDDALSSGEPVLATIYHLACDCGAVELDVSGTPVVSAYCHCRSCREMYGVEMLSASAWTSDAVTRRVATGTDLIAHRQPGRRMWRYHCAACGRLVHGRNRHGYLVIPTQRFRVAGDDRLPGPLEPTAHLFYDQRVIDIGDELPKHADDGDLFSESHTEA